MVGQAAAHLLHRHVRQAGMVEDLAGGFGAAQPRFDTDSYVFAIRLGELDLCVNAEDEPRYREEQP